MQLKQGLKEILTENEIKLMTNNYDLVGDILILDLPRQLKAKEKQIGKRILNFVHNAKVVAGRGTIHQGEYRTRDLQLIGGEQRQETMHKESGIRLYLNPWEVYFSVRSSGERLTLAQEIQPGEKIAVLGSGIGPFPLVLAKHSNPAMIIGIEKNPAAHRFAVKNLATNKLAEKVRFIQGDATTLRQQGEQYDRVINVLPTRHTELLPCSLQSVRQGGTLNHYAMVHGKDTATIINQIETACHNGGHYIDKKNISIRKCGHTGSQTDRCCFTVQL